jgi:superfamily II DNA or RNA helicase
VKKLQSGIYEKVINTHIEEKIRELRLNIDQINKESLKKFDSSVILAQYLTPVLKKSLDFLQDATDYPLPEQISCCNQIIEGLSLITKQDCLTQCKIKEDGEILLSIGQGLSTIPGSHNTVRPITPLSQTSLFTGASKEPSLIQELKAEIATSDHIDILVSFIKWSGIRLLVNELMQFCERGRLRVITTAYMGATDIKAVAVLASLPNTEVRISYDTAHTRLHAKAYYFHRNSGFSTAYIGSSNLSNAAITSGLEWNVKLTERDSLAIIRKIQATFESYWNDPDFEQYAENERERFLIAIRQERTKSDNEISPVFFDISPYPFQKEILEKLQAEREIHNRFRNLIVSATGTGKTVISAFDFKRYKQKKSDARILFVAHREEILKQSLTTFRTILKDQNFGDLCIGGIIPPQIDHLFISIQTFNSANFPAMTSPNSYDFIIVDEFHHAAAQSYQNLLTYYHPKILLGLTATPERMDNLDILSYFDGRIAAEIRLSEAIGRNLLAPFHYFGITDTVDLDDVDWVRGKYNTEILSKKYTGNNQRADLILNKVFEYVNDINEVIGLGFCVSIEHAKYMATVFSDLGIPSVHLSSVSSKEERNSVQKRLKNKDINFIFVVDLYNEGIDIPEVNTILFLRPTESLTVFIQQLGRGLRLSEGKECLTVLDFVGRQNTNYQFNDKYRALVREVRIPLSQQIREDNFSLPRGCFITLEKVAKETVLSHIEKTLSKRKTLVQKISQFEQESKIQLNIKEFLLYHKLKPQDIYYKSSFRKLCAEAKVCEVPSESEERFVTTAAKRMLHLNSISLIRFIRQFLSNKSLNFIENEKKKKESYRNLLYYSFYAKPIKDEDNLDFISSIQIFLSKEWIVNEIDSLLSFLEEKTEVLEEDLKIGFDLGLCLYCSYSRDQIFAGLGHWTPQHANPKGKREGVLFLPEKNLDCFFITLNKSEKRFSPSTMYNDYAINETIFHWQSQSTTSDTSPTGTRYINHQKIGTKILLFVREYDKINNISQPFVCLGTARYLNHEGSRPMNITWKLDNPIPANLMKRANKAISI